MALVLPIELLREKARARGLLDEALESCAAGLASGRNVLLIDTGIERGVALAEAIMGTACEIGACLGSVTLSEHSSRLLSLEDVVSAPLHDDFWLLIRQADGGTAVRIADYSQRSRLERGWRAILVARGPLSRLLSETDSRTRRRFAWVELAA